MGLKGKLVSQISVKWDGDLFEIFKAPHHLSQITPHMVQSVDLLSGSWGTPGAVLFWTYHLDGVKSVAKEIIESVVVDEKKKSITKKVIEGDLMKYFTLFKIGTAVEGDGEDKMLTWTLEYEKRNEAVPDPTSFMELCMTVSKDMERSRLLVPN